MISRVRVWACPEQDCEAFDSLRWQNHCASFNCAFEGHRPAVQIEVVPLSEVKETLLSKTAVDALQDFLWAHADNTRENAKAAAQALADAAFPSTDSEGQG